MCLAISLENYLNMPMIAKPKPWAIAEDRLNTPGKDLSLFDLEGGYYNPYYGDGFRLLLGKMKEHFFVYFGEKQLLSTHKRAEQLCKVMNTLENQPFIINEGYLNFLLTHNDYLVRTGFLMPAFLNHIDFKVAIDIIRDLRSKESENFQKTYTLNSIVHILEYNIQRARYEQNVLEMAYAYRGFRIYLPAAIDFRGRIYRTGILHFHERDLSRSLLLFDVGMSYGANCYRAETIDRCGEDTFYHLRDETREDFPDIIKGKVLYNNPDLMNQIHRSYYAAGGFHYKSYECDMAAGAMRIVIKGVITQYRARRNQVFLLSSLRDMNLCPCCQ
ncbi:orf329 (mitochondrion) [Beta vulgaris subsp. vulgaris]|uniref:Orf329 protein n=3 Tax=Beta TaxID=3554 RepID=Q9MFE7_BETVV|nr:orf329 [Beta vulgaris subsp. vulgaris]YP_004222242.1 hypothetical protein LKY74_mgp003 [Beta vulgaris subsp. maritima]YP_004842092.1 hypothetical protein LKY79_mgp116 [Beta macrocarpa]CBJ14027.1 hypothetical protein [Beta vulgaris subsp. maritima]CBJ17485.1 hypothetical protein [Beta vulgaris subsp. maritima]CBL52005.1 hypothetical protein [Beta vulgaris subsp. maritima]CBX24894.1 hypothetical protein [Beta macrocarpa]BAA99295.1 orf329 [Beta vulgaris subsp. vulgaris]